MANVCGLILAAGASSRMGSDKALLPWPPTNTGGTTLLTAAIARLKPYTQAIVVVAGKNADNLAPIIVSSGASMARNPNPEQGQFSSLRIGLRAVLAQGCDTAMITPVDCPPLSTSSIELLREAFGKALARGCWAVAPERDGKRGHPLLASRALIDALLNAPAASNAREVLHAQAGLFESVPVPEPYLSADVNTPEEYAAIAAARYGPTR